MPKERDRPTSRSNSALGFFHKLRDPLHLQAIDRQVENVGYFTDNVIQGRVHVGVLDLVLTFVEGDDSSVILALACLAQRARSGTTGKQGAKWTDLVQIDIPAQEILVALPSEVGERLLRDLHLESSRPTPDDWNQVWATLKKLRPDLSAKLDALERKRKGLVLDVNSEKHEKIFCQRDAVGVSLDLAGIPREKVFSSIEKAITDDGSLLGALCGNATERVVLSHDVRVVDGFKPLGDISDHKCSFTYGDTVLDVYNVDVRPGERVLGVDLIYYNYSFESFVLVQYKMMEGDGDSWRYVRDDQCIAEEKRMDTALAQFAKLQTQTTPNAFRFSSNPFFFKLCKRDRELLLDTSRLTQGLYLHLDYWKAICEEQGNGTHGIGFGNAKRWICKTDFVNFVRSGWVGTRGVTPQWLVSYVSSAKASGRSTIVSVSSKQPRLWVE